MAAIFLYPDPIDFRVGIISWRIQTNSFHPVFFLNYNPVEVINIDFSEGGGSWSVRLFYFQGRVPSM
jgi:hypothetical protein